MHYSTVERKRFYKKVSVYKTEGTHDASPRHCTCLLDIPTPMCRGIRCSTGPQKAENSFQGVPGSPNAATGTGSRRGVGLARLAPATLHHASGASIHLTNSSPPFSLLRLLCVTPYWTTHTPAPPPPQWKLSSPTSTLTHFCTSLL